METINQFLAAAVGYIWGIPLVVLLCGTGLLLTITLGVQFRGFKHAFGVIRGKYDDPNDPGEINHFQALTTALSATVGLGNIAGVAVAIHVGGPGATFWMIMVGLLGMATKFAECTLGLMYRRIEPNGTVRGGAMHYIEQGLGSKWKPLAVTFAICAVCSSFGSGNMFQTNQVAAILENNFGISTTVTGLVLAGLVAAVIIGGIKRIGKVTSYLVPFMAGIYIIAALLVIFKNIGDVPDLIYMILHDAFTGTAAVGGFAGVAFREVLVQGVRRACFSNEAGMGSAPIAHSAAVTKEPVREGVVALLEPFIDTVVICTMTALVILISGAWQAEANGVELTAMAFDSVIPGFGQFFVPIAVALFGYSTLLSWSYYGEQATHYLFGNKGVLPFKIVYCIMAVMGAVWAIDPVLNFADAMFGLMGIPNLIAILLLFPKLRAETQNYFSRLKSGEMKALR